MANWRKSLRRLGTMAAVSEAEQIVERSCIGRIVSMLTLVLIVLGIALYGLMWYGLIRTGLAKQLPEPIGGALGLTLFAGFFIAIILAGLAGNWLRQRLWRILLRRVGARTQEKQA